MTGPVTQALQDYEQRLRDRGSAVLAHLRPGLPRERIDKLEQEFDVRLTGSARAVWGWHDGVGENRAQATLVPHRVLPSLRFSLFRGRQIAAAVNPILDEPEMAHRGWNRQWVILTTDGKVPRHRLQPRTQR